MAIPPRILSALALAALAGAAQAQTENYDWQVYHYFEAGVTSGLMSVEADSDHLGSLGWMAGYPFNRFVGVQAVGYGAVTPYHQALATDGTPRYDFVRFSGIEAVGYVPTTQYWDLFGGLGVGRSSYETLQSGYGAEHKTDGIVEAGIRWQMFEHFAASVGLSRVFDAQSTNGYLRAEVDF